MSSSREKRAGQGFLALVFLIGTVTVAIGATLIFLANSMVNSIYGYQSSQSAEAVATSGAQDALLRLARNPQWSAAGGYTLAVGSSTATVVVVQNSGTQTSILSTASVSSFTRKVQVVVDINASTSALTVTSWGDVQ